MSDVIEVINGEKDRMIKKDYVCETVIELLAEGVTERSKHCLHDCFGGQAELMVGETPRVRVNSRCRMLDDRG